MTDNEAIEFCNQWLPAWTGNKPEKLIEFYSDDAFYLDPAKPKGLQGRDRLLAYFGKLLAANPDWKWEAVEIYPTEQGFVGKWQATIPVGSETIVEQGMDIVEIADGKITRNEVYFNLSNIISALS